MKDSPVKVSQSDKDTLDSIKEKLRLKKVPFLERTNKALVSEGIALLKDKYMDL